MRFLHRLLALGATFALANVAGAQAEPAPGTDVDAPATRIRTFEITPRAGYLRFDRASSIENGGFLGLDATYRVTPMFGVTTNLVVSRAQTYGEDFLSAFRYGNPVLGDTTLILTATQPVTVVDVGIGGVAQLPGVSRLTPFVNAGVGSYTIYLDPQSNSRPSKFSRMSLSVGGGLKLALGRFGGLQLDVRDLIMTDYKRDRLNPTEPRFANVLFLDDLPQPPAAKSTVHNIQVSLGFTFRPTARAGEPTDEGTER
jgi:hypothetical protein